MAGHMQEKTGKYGNYKLNEFTSILGSETPAPGGGGGVALAAAIGASLARMTASLTLNKKGYEEVQGEVAELCSALRAHAETLLELIDKDEQGFLPLIDAYKMKAESEAERGEKRALIETKTLEAARVPVEIMKVTAESIDLCEKVAEVGSKNALSDVATAVTVLKGALLGASINVFVNTASLKSNHEAKVLEHVADKILIRYPIKADEIFGRIYKDIRSI